MMKREKVSFLLGTVAVGASSGYYMKFWVCRGFSVQWDLP